MTRSSATATAINPATEAMRLMTPLRAARIGSSVLW